MEPEFITFQQFNDRALADELAAQLAHFHIKYFLVEEKQTFDPGFRFNDTLTNYWAVKIKNEDFEKVNRLLKDAESTGIAEIGKDYYLYGFTDDELMDVILKADEWSAFDFALARKILIEKGNDLNDNVIAAINKKRIEELKQPDPPQTGWIIIGYVFALIGGLLGIFIGWYLTTFKKTLPNGERVYEYNETDRKHGRRVFYIGIVVLVCCVCYKIASVFAL